MNAPDLRQRPPRSPRVRLGGYVILPRMLDKGRATIAGMNGEYSYACALDKRFLEFTGVDPDALRTELEKGRGDGDILDWIRSNSKIPRTDAEIAGWSALQEQRGPSDTASREFYQSVHQKVAPRRTDLSSWFDLLDVDDLVTFGGAA